MLVKSVLDECSPLIGLLLKLLAQPGQAESGNQASISGLGHAKEEKEISCMFPDLVHS